MPHPHGAGMLINLGTMVWPAPAPPPCPPPPPPSPFFLPPPSYSRFRLPYHLPFTCVTARAAGDVQAKIYSLSAQLAQAKQDRDEMAAALDAAGLGRGIHASHVDQSAARPAWDRRTRQQGLSHQQSAFPAGDQPLAAYGRSALQHQASAAAPERSRVSFVQQHGSYSGPSAGQPHSNAGIIPRSPAGLRAALLEHGRRGAPRSVCMARFPIYLVNNRW